jgi:hypothetical protein
MDYTAKINQYNIQNVQRQISKKISPNVFYANGNDVLGVITDHDVQPYNKWFRGISYFPNPIIAERESGYRKVHNQCYNNIRPIEKDKQPENCFEAPCSTTFRCFPKKDDEYKQRELNNDKLCIVQYR